MRAGVWGVVAAFAGFGAAFPAVFRAAFYWLAAAIQRSSAENRAGFRQEAQERRADMQRSFDALCRHRHDGGGAAGLPESADWISVAEKL